MSYCYTVGLNNTAIGAATTLVAIRPGAAFGCKIRRIQVTQGSSATSAACRIQWGRKAAVLPSALTAVTPTKVDEKDAASLFTGGTSAAAGTCGVNSTTMGGGTLTLLGEAGFNNLNGFEVVFGPGEEPTFRAGSADCFVLVAPASMTGNYDWYVTFEEI
ncbi:MAG: hypothetical protein WAT39_07070 [Planctomycetota bacterium]